MKPIFANPIIEKITLIDDGKIVSNEREVIECFTMLLACKHSSNFYTKSCINATEISILIEGWYYYEMVTIHGNYIKYSIL